MFLPVPLSPFSLLPLILFVFSSPYKSSSHLSLFHHFPFYPLILFEFSSPTNQVLSCPYFTIFPSTPYFDCVPLPYKSSSHLSLFSIFSSTPLFCLNSPPPTNQVLTCPYFTIFSSTPLFCLNSPPPANQVLSCPYSPFVPIHHFPFYPLILFVFSSPYKSCSHLCLLFFNLYSLIFLVPTFSLFSQYL